MSHAATARPATTTRDVSPDQMRGTAAPLDPSSAAGATALRGVDLVEQVAHSAKIQKQRWAEILTKLWERKASLDVADTILIRGGTPYAWFFTSSVTGEIQKKLDRKLNAIAIKKQFVRMSDPALVSRRLAVLLHEDRDGSIKYSALSDLEFNAVLCQPSSPLWMASFLLQPFTPHFRATFVAKFNALATSSCIRVLHADSYFYDVARASPALRTALLEKSSAPARRAGAAAAAPAEDKQLPVAPTAPHNTSSSGDSSSSSRSLPSGASGLSRPLEEIIKAELKRLVREVESAFKDKLRLLDGEFQVTSTNRLVLVRVSRVVFFSDLKVRKEQSGGKAASKKAPKPRRPSSASSLPSAKHCAGDSFCHCKVFASAAALRVPLPSAHDFQRITRKSLSLSDEESAHLELFGAHAEATLAVSATALRANAHDAFTKLLQRRIFMLQSTLWNPKSDAFKVKPLDFCDAKKLPQQYEMVTVCKTCYLIYHTIDGERFQASRSTSRAAARLYNAKMLSRLENALPPHAAVAAAAGVAHSRVDPSRARAWETDQEDTTSL
ncbi:hypothetical protein PybrP1_006841 [[Pythium] brassicae (nom. inval.)]|nr:hypothetical protein PybrP1_006841 [[Pythium] brassicae (nom. inval.)]